MKRLLTLCIVVFAFFSNPFASNTEVLPSHLIDSAKVILVRKDYQRAKFLLHQALDLSERKKDTSSLLRSMLFLEKLYTEQGQNDSAVILCHKRLNINRLKKNYQSLSDNFRALNTLLSTNIGANASGGLMDSCLHYALLSHDDKAIAVAYTNYGTYIFTKDKRRGLDYLKTAITKSNSIPNDIIYIYARVQLAEILIGMDSLIKAKHYLGEALKKAIETNEKIQRTHVYLALGSISLKEEHLVDAIDELHKARIIAEIIPIKYYLPDIYENLSQAFRKKGLVDSSFYYNDKATAAQQQLVNEKTNQQVAEVNAKYQLESKQSTIEKLGIKVITYKRLILLIALGLLVIVTFIGIYLYRFKPHNKGNILFRIDSSKGARRINSSLPQSFKNEFEEILIKGEIYTQADLTLQKLADLLCTNTTYLSRFINDEYKTNFSQLLNHYRIEKASLMLLDNKMDNLTIEAIAQSAGFNSKSTFNTAFKNQKGITPTQWKESFKSTINQ